MEKVTDVANWFLSQEPMTHKKLQKLCYYAQAWYCALYDGSPLFEDEIQAWVHGPVIPTLYPLYADYRWNKIPQCNFDDKVFTEREKVVDILTAVKNTYMDYSGDQLESLTHSEDPWIQARGNLKPWEVSRNTISLESMIDFYRSEYDKTQDA